MEIKIVDGKLILGILTEVTPRYFRVLSGLRVLRKFKSIATKIAKKSSAKIAKLFSFEILVKFKRKDMRKASAINRSRLVFLLDLLGFRLALLFFEEFEQAVHQALLAADHVQAAFLLVFLENFV